MKGTKRSKACLCRHNMADEVSHLLGGLAHYQRLMVVTLLGDVKEMHVNEMVDKLNVNRAALSRHLAKLRAMKIVKTRRRHNRIYYALAHDKAVKIVSALRLAANRPQ